MGEIDRSNHLVELGSAMLWYVIKGSATVVVRVGDQVRTWRVGGNQCIWIDNGARVRIDRAPGSAVLGFRSPPPSELPFNVAGAPSVHSVPVQLRDRFIGKFADSLGYLRPSSDPGIPSSPAARAAARQIVADFTVVRSVPELAASVHVSPATLNRAFRNDTGLSVGKWRMRARAKHARLLVDSGLTLDAAAHRVGLSSGSALSRLLRFPTPTFTHHTPTPTPRSTWPRTNRMNVLVWVYSGTARVTVADQHLDASAGDLVWLPAGLPNVVELGDDCLVLPLGARIGSSHGRSGPVPVGSGDASDADLLAACAREYDPVNAGATDAVDQYFYDFLAGGGQSNDSVILSKLLKFMRAQPSNDRSVQEWAEHLGCSAEQLNVAIEAAGFGSFFSWRSHTRMGIARRLLHADVPVAKVAEHLGYSGVSSFSHVFARHHGVSPRSYRGYV